jgi:tellurite resistance protein TerC
MLPRFRFLKHGLSAVLVLIGARMLLDHFVELPTTLTLSIVVGILAAASILSIVFPERGDRADG